MSGRGFAGGKRNRIVEMAGVGVGRGVEGRGREIVSLRTALFHSFCPDLGHFLWFLIKDNWSLAKFCRYQVAQQHPYGSLFQLKLGQIPASFMFSHGSSNLYPYLPNCHNFTWDNLELQWPFWGTFDKNKIVYSKGTSEQKRKKPSWGNCLVCQKERLVCLV